MTATRVATDDRHYTHDQVVASTTWTVVHSLGKRVSVTVVDSGDNVVIGEVAYVSDNQVVVTFSASFGGKCYCN